MPLPYHLIDGYNLLHAAGLARASYGPGDLERARTALLVRLADGLDDAERPRTTVVFDAADPPPDAERSFRFREMAVIFSVDEGEADALIEELIRRHPSPRQLRVVSEDIRLQKAAKRRGAQAVKSEAFLDRLKRRAGGSDPPSAKASPADVEGEASDWLEFFGMTGGAVTVADLPGDRRRDQSLGAPKREALEREQDARVRSTRRDAGTPPATPKRLADAVATETDEAAESEEFGFWQQRIDELVRDEERRSGGR